MKRAVIVYVFLISYAANAFASSDIVNRCQELERDFNFDAVLRECSASASDPRLPTAERLLFLRLLGIAHASLGDEKKAQLWFQQLLILDPNFTMSDGQSPRLLATFNKAKTRFQKEGFIDVKHLSPPPPQEQRSAIKLSFSLQDKLAQTMRGEVVVNVQLEDGTLQEIEPLPLVKGQKESNGRVLWTANLLIPAEILTHESNLLIRYTLRLYHAGGDEITNRSPPIKHTLLIKKNKKNTLLMPITIGSASIGAVLLATGVTSAAVFWCISDPACAGPPAQAPPTTGSLKVEIFLGAQQ